MYLIVITKSTYYVGWWAPVIITLHFTCCTVWELAWLTGCCEQQQSAKFLITLLHIKHFTAINLCPRPCTDDWQSATLLLWCVYYTISPCHYKTRVYTNDISSPISVPLPLSNWLDIGESHSFACQSSIRLNSAGQLTTGIKCFLSRSKKN